MLCFGAGSHRAFGHSGRLRRNVFVLPFPLSGTRWTHVYSSFFCCTKNACRFFTVPPSRYLHFYRMHHTKQRNNRKPVIRSFRFRRHLCDYNRFFVGLILMQGRKWIENVSIAIVPTMAIFFFGGCLLYLILPQIIFCPL